MRAPRGQRVQATIGTPDKEAAQVRFGVLAGGALEPGQIGGHRQPQQISERHKTIEGD
jgi:hypothetical protein